MNTNEIYPPKYFKQEDLGTEVLLTISGVDFEAVGEDRERKAVVHFEGESRGLVLNKTNMRRIKKQYGGETDDWVGHTIVLCREKTTYKGDLVDSVRVKEGTDEEAPF
jgi:hypothetical protein